MLPSKLACQMSVFEMLAQVNFSKDITFGGLADSVYKLWVLSHTPDEQRRLSRP